MDAADCPSITRRAALHRLALATLGAVVLPPLASLAGCADPGPRPIAYGRDECAWCRMTVSDARYGAVLMTPTGKQQAFDSVECLGEATLALPAPEHANAASRSWVTDWLHPGTLVPVSTAHFLRGEGPGSPMGKGLRAYASLPDAEQEQHRTGGVMMSWEEVLDVIGGARAARA